MRKKMLLAGAALAMLGTSANAAIIVQGFSISAGTWFGGGNPYGGGTNPALTGTITVDTANSTGTSFSAISYVTGSKTWTLGDIDVANSSVAFSAGLVTSFNLVFNTAGNYVYSNNTAALFDGRTSIACNGCVSLAAATGAVPEPTTWAMMIGGFGLIGGALRYRRRGTRVTFA